MSRYLSGPKAPMLCRCFVHDNIAVQNCPLGLNPERPATEKVLEGQESDIVIYNIVRSNPYFSIGFLENYKRLNVAISRAHAFYSS
uniref:DNA2/NAM7 helicase-like C-terminal domain-containing protein n=1 Tax=Romanomermis culicivorax TaxID=13658 RepID=A0A915J3H7_ROMCU